MSLSDSNLQSHNNIISLQMVIVIYTKICLQKNVLVCIEWRKINSYLPEEYTPGFPGNLRCKFPMNTYPLEAVTHYCVVEHARDHYYVKKKFLKDFSKNSEVTTEFLENLVNGSE